MIYYNIDNIFFWKSGGKPCGIGGGGEKEKDPGGHHDKAGWYVVQENVPVKSQDMSSEK